MTLRRRSQTLVVGITAALIAQACSRSHPAETSARSQLVPPPIIQAAGGSDADTLRAEGPVALERLLVEHDAATGKKRARLATLIDQVAGQRYATVSRLFWHTDLTDAQAAARASGKPILSLRMLGRLDEDQSCANSRFFRVALYANAELSAWMRDHFILHWSSERPVPKVTIDFGDGRRIDTTIAGNSAHYVLDADGVVLDVLPGLLTPRAFRHQLEGSLELADTIAAASSDGARERILALHHTEAAQAIDQTWQALGAMPIPDQTWETSLAQAERRAMAKSSIESPMVKTAALGADPSNLPADSVAWQQVGIRVLALLGLEEGGGDRGWAGAEVNARYLPPPAILDDQSRALIATLAPTDWSREAGTLDDAQLTAMVRTFEGLIVADSGLNLTRLRAQIHEHLASFAGSRLPLDFESVNAWVYASVFLTPATDPWLGMATPGAFTGLPGDGVTSR